MRLLRVESEKVPHGRHLRRERLKVVPEVLLHPFVRPRRRYDYLMRCRRLRDYHRLMSNWPRLLLLLLSRDHHQAAAAGTSRCIGVIQRPRVVRVAALDDPREERPPAGALAGAGGAAGALLLHAAAVPADLAPPGRSAAARRGGGGGRPLVVRVVAGHARGLPAVALAPARLPVLYADTVIADGRLGSVSAFAWHLGLYV